MVSPKHTHIATLNGLRHFINVCVYNNKEVINLDGGDEGRRKRGGMIYSPPMKFSI